MTRPLITAGCSMTDIDLPIYKKLGIMAWPYIVANELDLTLIDLAIGGSSNSHIESQALDAAIKYKDLDPIVMVLWTNPRRINFNDCYTVLGNWNDDVEHMTNCKSHWMFNDSDIAYTTLRFSLRSMWRTMNTIKSFGLDYYHDIGTWEIPYLVKTQLKDVHASLKEDWYYQNLDFSMRTIEEGWTGYNRIPDDGHPDQEAHEIMAQRFIDKYRSKFNKEDFVYE